MIAASLHRFAISAPLKPGDNYDRRLATVFMSVLGSILRGVRCTINIYYLALTSGSVISTILSKRPGLVKALSKVYLRFVAAKTTIVSLLENPSIYTSN